MFGNKKQDTTPYLVETPVGIFTLAGNWFHTTKDSINQYVPGLLEAFPLLKLIKDAEVWVRSADSITLVLFMLVAYLANAYIAAVVALLFLPFWHYNKSAFVSYSLTNILKIFDVEFVVVLISVAVLSVKGMNGLYVELGIGFFFFFILKFGWYLKLISKWMDSGDKMVTLNDRVLKMILVKYAMHEGITPEEISKWESDIRDLMVKRKRR